LPAFGFNQYNVSVLSSATYSIRSDFARVISRKFHGGRLLIIGDGPKELEQQFREIGREAVLVASPADLTAALSRDGVVADFEIAIWFYPPEKSYDKRICEELSRCVNGIVLIPGAGASLASRRPQLVECFGQFGRSPDYGCDLSEVHPGALLLRHQLSANSELLISEAETAFARFNARLDGVERILRTRVSELEAADRHIAALQEKLLKLKQYRGELKLLKEQRQALRRSPERRIGQVLLTPYRIPERLVKAAWNKLRPASAKRPRSAAPTEYQEWLQQHRATSDDLDRMRQEARGFVSQPLVSIITPVFNTPVPWLRECVESVLAQAYEKWELILIDDGSTDPEMLRSLTELAASDSRIILAKDEKRRGISAASNRGLALAQGDWVAFLDHDDLLEPDALFQNVKWLQDHPAADLIYSDEDKLTEQGFDSPIFKPDWSPDYFLSCNYVCHFTLIRRELVKQLGGFRSEFDCAQDYDLFLRVTEQTDRIDHIPRVLYHWRRSLTSIADNIRGKPRTLEAGRLALEAHLERRQQTGHVAVDWRTYLYWVKRELTEAKKISIIIPVRDRVDLLARCIDSLTSKTSYAPYEIVVVDNDSQSEEARAYFSHFKHRLLHYRGPFNFSAVNNFAVKQTDSPWLLFLNYATEVFDGDWLITMAEHVQRPEVGAVGPRLLYPDATVQHAGIVVGVGGIAGHAFRGLPAEAPNVCHQLQATCNYSAVTGACLLTRRDVFEEVEGFDEECLPVTFSDVDLCLKMRRAGYLIVYTPFAKLHYHESGTRRLAVEPLETEVMRQRWPQVLERDPYYNPNLSRDHADFSLGK
jgi:glycosyltransferase involved in cell wall biosynthesis